MSSEGSRYLFPTEAFRFGKGALGQECFVGWKGRICRPDAPAAWFGDAASKPYELGLQLTKDPQ